MVPGSTTYRPDGQASRCLPFVSLVSGAVLERSAPFTEIPRADSSTTSPDLATIGFNRGAAPSWQIPGSRYPRTMANVANGSAGQNSTILAPASAVVI